MESFAVSIMGRYTVHPLALIVLFAAWQTAHSCSSFLLNETFGPGCLSGRTMDFETDLGSEIGYMPKGTELKLLPLCQGAPSPKLTTKHAFAFLTSARSVVQSFHAVRETHFSPEPNECHGQCFRNPSRARLVAGLHRVCAWYRTLGCRREMFLRLFLTASTTKAFQ